MNYNMSGSNLDKRVEHLEGQIGESLRAQGAMAAQLTAQGREMSELRADIKAIAGKLDGVGRLDSKTILSIISTGITAIAVSITIVAYVGTLALDPIAKRIDWNTEYFTERTKSRFTAEEGHDLQRRLEANVANDAKAHAELDKRLSIVETLLKKN